MVTSRTRRFSLVTLFGIVLAVALAPVASAATQRYADPKGSGTDCSAVIPCSISWAIEHAALNDEVIVKPGDYAITAELSDPAPITIHGIAGQPRPRLLLAGGNEFVGLRQGSTLRRVEIDKPAQGALWATGAIVDQVIVRAPNLPLFVENSTIRNSIVVATAPNALAIRSVSNSLTNSVLYNVTAVATGTGGVAVDAFSQGGGTVFIGAGNVIARGGPGGASFRARTDSLGGHATIGVGHSSYAPGTLVTAGTNAGFTYGGGNLGLAPVFVNAAAGDYRQAPGSPTIGAGLDDPKNGALDVDGDPRAIGTTDIGADEFVAAPTATTGSVGALTEQSAALSGGVNPNGSPTSYRFEYGPTAAYGGTTSATGVGSGTATVQAGATLGGLTPATTYHYRIVASNAGGVTNGGDKIFTTTAPTTTTGGQLATALPFAGVRLVSTRLTMARRVITLKLSCPAGTVGRCSGRTKLSARRRRTGSRVASTVSLGRAPFSIASGKQAKVKLRVSRAGRSLLRRTRRLRAKDTNAAH